MGRPAFYRDGVAAKLLRGLEPIGRRPPRSYTSESADLSSKRTITIGEGYILADVHPDDLRGPLREWLDGGGSVSVDYRPNADEETGSVSVSIYIDDAEAASDPSWSQRPARIRIVPRDGSTMAELLSALGFDGFG